MIRIEIRVGPHGSECSYSGLWINRAIAQIYSSAIVWAAIGDWVNFCAARTSHIDHRLMGLALLVNPSLNDLQSLQRRTQRVCCRHHEEIGFVVL